MVGQVLSDRYELEELVGTGGMSSVFRAHDRLLDRKVALKVLHEQYMEDADYVERFRHEARAVAALSHPNIVTVIDRGEHNNRQFIVFEYVDGENLKRMIERRGPAPVTTALELAMQIARGLSFAHQQGLVHRDVKPQNVLLNGDGQAKVTDFGIARSLDVQHGMTQTGTVLGTSDYIAPEQAQGQRVDEHTDIYSPGGVIAYLAITRDHGTPTSTPPISTGAGTPVHLAAVTAYDPFGSGGEHDDKAGLATDGDGASYWETEHYNDAPSLGKQGVGLVLDAGRSVQLHAVGVSTATPGFVASIRAGDSKL